MCHDIMILTVCGFNLRGCGMVENDDSVANGDREEHCPRHFRHANVSSHFLIRPTKKGPRPVETWSLWRLYLGEWSLGLGSGLYSPRYSP